MDLKEFLGHLHPAPKRLFVGVSGGLDSVVLLHLLQEATEKKITVLHVNHNLQKASRDWSLFVEGIARQYQCHFKEYVLNLDDFSGENVENKAREERYEFFTGHLECESDYLFLAHHGQDQVETFFLNLQRGAGLDGLTGMSRSRSCGKGYLVRPLLDYSRHELKTYALENALQWVEDPSNKDINFSRNFLRQCILPELRERWPHFDKHVLQAMEHLQTVRLVLDEYLTQELAGLLLAVDQNNQSFGLKSILDLTKLQNLPSHSHTLLLQSWIKQASGKILNTKQLQVIITEVINAARDREPLFQIPGLIIKRKGKTLQLKLT